MRGFRAGPTRLCQSSTTRLHLTQRRMAKCTWTILKDSACVMIHNPRCKVSFIKWYLRSCLTLIEDPGFNDVGISTEFQFTSQQSSDRLEKNDPFFCSSLPTPATHSSPDSPSASSPPEDIVPDTDELSACSSPSPEPSSPNVQKARWRRVACLHPGCDRRFVSLHTQRTHMRTHETKSRQYFRCTMGCSEVFSRQHDRMRHEVTKHGRECKWSCDQCRKFFSFERTLKNHKCSGDGFSRWSLPSTYLISKNCAIELIVFSFLIFTATERGPPV